MKRTMGSKIRALFSAFRAQRAGTVIVAFAIMAPVIIGAGGSAMDFAEAYLVRQRLTNSLDAAALAAASSSSDPHEIEQRVQDFFNANYPEDKVGFTYDLKVTTVGEEVKVSAKADYNTGFLRVLGINKITVARSTTVNKEIRGLEVVMVLDNTGSMDEDATPGIKKITSLKSAAKIFATALMGEDGKTNKSVKVGMVPYASSVNVGPYGLGKTTTGGTYDSGNKFVTNPSGLSYDMSKTSAWHGCVLEYGIANENIEFNDPDPYDSSNLTAVDPGNGPWNMYRKSTCSNKQTCDQNGSCKTTSTTSGIDCIEYKNGTTCLTSHQEQGTCKTTSTSGPGDCIAYKNGTTCLASHQEQSSCKTTSTSGPGDCIAYKSNGSCKTYCKAWNYSTVCDEYNQVCKTYCKAYNYNTVCDSYNQVCKTWCKAYNCAHYATTRTCSLSSNPNTSCPVTPVLPLTNDKTKVVAAINTMTPSGSTLSNIGLVWGYRLLSPERPFTEGAGWTNKNWRKVAILMTDGMNSMSGYTAYGPDDLSGSIDNAELDARLKETCRKMKEDNITIYTVTFSTNSGDIDEPTKEIYRECASDGKYIHAPSDQALKDAFGTIGKELANLHISE